MEGSDNVQGNYSDNVQGNYSDNVQGNYSDNVQGNYYIEIDYRETKILKLIDENITNKCNDTVYGPVNMNNMIFYYKITNLPIGDFILKKNDEILFIIERKCISDLSASIIDGRFREQKNRLLESNCDIIYIIEGSIQCHRGSIPNLTLKSSILNLILKHNFKVVKTESDKDTLDNILLIYKKMLESNKTIEKTQSLKKKSDCANVFLNQLTCINGISSIMASKIIEKYDSLFNLVHAYDNLELSERENLLADIIINDKRKIGKAASKKIYNSLIK